MFWKFFIIFSTFFYFTRMVQFSIVTDADRNGFWLIQVNFFEKTHHQRVALRKKWVSFYLTYFSLYVLHFSFFVTIFIFIFIFYFLFFILCFFSLFLFFLFIVSENSFFFPLYKILNFSNDLLYTRMWCLSLFFSVY